MFSFKLVYAVENVSEGANISFLIFIKLAIACAHLEAAVLHVYLHGTLLTWIAAFW